MHKWAIRHGTFLTVDDLNGFLIKDGTMVVENGVITALGNDVDKKALEGCCEVIDGRRRLYMPGLVNTHGHAAMSLLRGYADDLVLQVWLQEKMWPHEAKFTDRDVYWGTMLSIVEMLGTGTTCFVDMYDHMDQVALAVEQSGIRACLTRGMIGNVPEAEARAKLKEAREFAATWHGQADGRITAMMSPHSLYTCSPGFIEQVVAIAHELDLPIHTHMSETALEVEENVLRSGLRPPAELDRLGVFDRPCLVAHAVHVNVEEIALLKEKDVRVSHNPGSNLKLASGVAPVPAMLEAGVCVSLGTDSSASNNNLDMFEEMRLAALIHKAVSGDPTAVPAQAALAMATRDGARSIWLENVGVLRPGMKADLIALDLDQPHLQPVEHIQSHVVYSASGHDVTDVWVDGKPIVRNRAFTTLDAEKIRAEFNACCRKIFGGER